MTLILGTHDDHVTCRCRALVSLADTHCGRCGSVVTLPGETATETYSRILALVASRN